MELLEGRVLKGEYTPFKVPLSPEAAGCTSNSLAGTKYNAYQVVLQLRAEVLTVEALQYAWSHLIAGVAVYISAIGAWSETIAVCQV